MIVGRKIEGALAFKEIVRRRYASGNARCAAQPGDKMRQQHVTNGQLHILQIIVVEEPGKIALRAGIYGQDFVSQVSQIKSERCFSYASAKIADGIGVESGKGQGFGLASGDLELPADQFFKNVRHGVPPKFVPQFI